MCVWEKDRSQPDPYRHSLQGAFLVDHFVISSDGSFFVSAPSLHEIRLALAREEDDNARRGDLAPHKITQSLFLQEGLELEEEQ